MSKEALSARDVVTEIERLAPPEQKAPWDRSGFQVGDPARSVSRILTALEITQAVLAEAIRWKADMLVVHHPIIFRPLEDLNESHPPTAVLAGLVRSRVGVYAAHTSFDVSPHSISGRVLELLGVKEVEPVLPKRSAGQVKIVVFCPPRHAGRVRSAMASEGAGIIGEYEMCSFGTRGEGTFRGSERTSPSIGKAGRLETVEEIRLEMVCPKGKLGRVITAMVKVHPYEEPAYDIYPLEDLLFEDHLIWRGHLPKAIPLASLAKSASSKLAAGEPLRVIGKATRKVKFLAAASGSGGSLISKVSGLGVDCFLTGDVGHHDARLAEDLGLAVIDLGHYWSELPFGRVMADLLRDRLAGRNVEIRIARSLKPPWYSITA